MRGFWIRMPSAAPEVTCSEEVAVVPKPQYGAEHQAIREQLLRDLVPGTPCRKCKKPMFRGQELDAAHSEDVVANPNAKADHLLHSSCNRGDGGRLGSERSRMNPSRPW